MAQDETGNLSTAGGLGRSAPSLGQQGTACPGSVLSFQGRLDQTHPECCSQWHQGVLMAMHRLAGRQHLLWAMPSSKSSWSSAFPKEKESIWCIRTAGCPSTHLLLAMLLLVPQKLPWVYLHLITESIFGE